MVSQQPIAYVQIRDPEGKLSRAPIFENRAIIGRSKTAQVQLDRPSISRHHAELSRDPYGRWIVRDLGSRLGLKVKDKIVKQAALRFGEQFEVGKYSLKLWNLRPLASKPAALPSAASTIRTNDPSHETVSNFRALTEIDSPKIDTMHLSTLTEFGQRLADVDSADERLRMLCRFIVRKDFHGLTAMALRVNKDRPDDPFEVLNEPQHAVGFHQESQYVSRSLIRTVNESKAPVLASSVTTDQGVVEMTIAPELIASGSESIAAVGCPLAEDDTSLDILYVTFPPEFGTAEWMAVVALAATQYQQAESTWLARTEAQNHAAIEQDLRSARHIQEGLVPKNIAFTQMDVALKYQPCEWVGGDYVDAAIMNDGRIFLTVADVSGHGLPAALIALSMHSMVHTFIRTDTPLIKIINGLNDHLCAFLDEQKFVTMVCMILDPETGEIECVNAGHPPAMVFAPDGTGRALQSSLHLPLGIEPTEFTTQQDTIEPGFMLAMYSDGLTEIMDNDRNLIGIEGINDFLSKFIAAKLHKGTEAISKSLFDALDGYSSNLLPNDDRSCLLAHWKGNGQN